MSLAYEMDVRNEAPPQRPMNGEWCDRHGAHGLKEKIEAYWRERGYDVKIEIYEAGFSMAMRTTRFDVRSDMVNGLPRKRLQDAP